MKFTENMNVFAGYCSPHRMLVPITARNRPCPDQSRMETARGEAAEQTISEALYTNTSKSKDANITNRQSVRTKER